MGLTHAHCARQSNCAARVGHIGPSPQRRPLHPSPSLPAARPPIALPTDCQSTVCQKHLYAMEALAAFTTLSTVMPNMS